MSLRYGKRIVCLVGRYQVGVMHAATMSRTCTDTSAVQAAVDILIKHSGETMDRPRHPAAFEILSGGLRVVLTPAGDRIKRYRKYADD